jgi:hypothetical protein
MMGNFCTRMARRIRLLGYAPKRAIWYAGFFFTSMVSVCGMMGVLNIQPEGGYGWITGSGKFPQGARAGSGSPDFFGLRWY